MLGRRNERHIRQDRLMFRLRKNKSGKKVITNEKLGEKGNAGKKQGRGWVGRKYRSEDGKRQTW